jgi:hypothetical protein
MAYKSARSEGFGVHLDFRGADDDIPELDMRARRARMGPLEKCIQMQYLEASLSMLSENPIRQSPL